MDENELLRIHSVLHLIFHRNRNQHGRTKWWKWLSILKRTVRELAFSSSGDRGDSRSSAKHSRRYLADQILPRCYVAFSVVVADVQFSTLGTVLLATLAQLSKVTGIDEELKSRSQIQPRFGLVSPPHVRPVKAKEDIGEALSRNEDVSDRGQIPVTKQAPRPNAEDPVPTPAKTISVHEVSATAKPKARNKKKGRNAIDDLFSGLL
ncbi:uncharacterized protein BDV14DRAFT_24271 [Aspergillus stella-maris]|uniref:uncharacterized protein n=1 Tax=Aspergillus stella-maris TaxID=1810926 RepID=UPI003CCD02FA